MLPWWQNRCAYSFWKCNGQTSTLQHGPAKNKQRNKEIKHLINAALNKHFFLVECMRYCWKMMLLGWGFSNLSYCKYQCDAEWVFLTRGTELGSSEFLLYGALLVLIPATNWNLTSLQLKISICPYCGKGHQCLWKYWNHSVFSIIWCFWR